MKVKSLSFSMISTFRQCPGKFVRVYHHRDKRPLAEAAQEGSVFHDVVQLWMPDKTQNWRLILKDIVRNKISEFTGKRAYEELTFDQYMGAYRLLKVFTSRQDVLEVKNTIAYELHFDFTLPNGVPINGRIDRVDQCDDGYIEVTDYKTSRSYIYKNEVEDSLQGMMYALAACYKLFPGRKFRFTIDAIRFSPITVEFTPDQLDAAMDYLELTWNEIEALDPDSAEFKPNRYCGFCAYKDDPEVCSAVQEVTKTIAGEELMPDLHAYARKVIELEAHEKTVKKLRGSYESRLDSALVEMGKQHMDFGDCFIFYKQLAGGPTMRIVDKPGGFANVGK